MPQMPNLELQSASERRCIPVTNLFAIVLGVLLVSACSGAASSSSESQSNVRPTATQPVDLDLVAAHLATDELVRSALTEAKYDEYDSYKITADPRLPIDYALAIAVILTYPDRGNQFDRPTQESTVDLFNVSLRFASDLALLLAEKPEYLLNVVKNRSAYATAAKAEAASFAAAELRRNKNVTREVVIRARELAAKLPALKTGDFVKARDTLKSRFRGVLANNPDLVRPLLENFTVGPEVEASRAEIRAIVAEVQKSR